jgi:phthalate 4,5-cis-dihydrodiol dehydrogenase
MIPKLKFGVAGLGRAFSLMAPSLRADPRVALVAGADPRPEARSRLQRDFDARAYATVEELCADAAVDVVYIATPHQLHAAHARLAASHKKHVLVEKPMALTLEDCGAMIAATQAAGVRLVVGHSHSFDAPIQLARRIVESGALGAVRMVSALNYTDFLYRPRRPEELDTAQGGGAVFNQAAHQVDVVRMLVPSEVKRVRACTGAWDPARPTEGAYSALLTFENGAFASLVYSGYAHFDSDELMGWIGESGAPKDATAYGAARRALEGDEAALKQARNFGGSAFRDVPAPQAHPHFGLLIVSCEHGDLRPLPDGVAIYADAERRIEPLAPPRTPRTEVIDEVYEALFEGKAPLHDGEWAMRTLAVCLAILRSAREQREVAL